MLNAPIRLNAPLNGSATVFRGTRHRVARAGAWGSSILLPEEEEVLRCNILKWQRVVCLSYWGGEEERGHGAISEDRLLCRSYVMTMTFPGLYDVVKGCSFYRGNRQENAAKCDKSEVQACSSSSSNDSLALGGIQWILTLADHTTCVHSVSHLA